MLIDLFSLFNQNYFSFFLNFLYSCLPVSRHSTVLNFISGTYTYIFTLVENIYEFKWKFFIIGFSIMLGQLLCLPAAVEMQKIDWINEWKNQLALDKGHIVLGWLKLGIHSVRHSKIVSTTKLHASHSSQWLIHYWSALLFLFNIFSVHYQACLIKVFLIVLNWFTVYWNKQMRQFCLQRQWTLNIYISVSGNLQS